MVGSILGDCSMKEGIGVSMVTYIILSTTTHPLSVMGVLLSPGLQHEFRSTSTFGAAMEAIAFDWNRDPEMRIHVELMVWVAKLVYPFLNIGGQGTVVNSEFLWQAGRERLMEFLQATTCADELEDLWLRMDPDEEVDPSGFVLEVSGQLEPVFAQGSGEAPTLEDGAEDVTMDSERAMGKASEISPEEETAASSSRLSSARMLLWSVYEGLPIGSPRCKTDRLGKSSTAQKVILERDRQMLVRIFLRGKCPGFLRIISMRWLQKSWKRPQSWVK